MGCGMERCPHREGDGCFPRPGREETEAGKFSKLGTVVTLFQVVDAVILEQCGMNPDGTDVSFEQWDPDLDTEYDYDDQGQVVGVSSIPLNLQLPVSLDLSR